MLQQRVLDFVIDSDIKEKEVREELQKTVARELRSLVVQIQDIENPQ